MHVPAGRDAAVEAHPAMPYAGVERVVRSQDLAAALSARELLADAHRQADRLLSEARAAASQLRAEAQRLAGEERQRAYAAGWEQAQRDFAARLTRREAHQAKGLSSQEERMCVLVTRTLAKVLTEQQNDERFFEAVMTRVLRAAREEKFLTVRVAAEQRDAAERAIRQVIDQTAAPNFIEVLGEAQLKRGACIVESAHGVIDASLDTQLDTIRDALLALWRPQP